MRALLRRGLPALACSLGVVPFAHGLQTTTPTGPNAPSHFHYTFAELLYLTGEVDDEDADGFQLGGSYAFNENFHVVGSYTTSDIDVPGGDVDADVLALGIGYHMPVADKLDLVAELQLLHAEFDFSGGDDDENGWSLGAGVRYWLADKVELNGGLEHVDLEDDDTGILIGGRYYFDERISAGLGLELFDDVETIGIGLRMHF
jgi:hypothetical protein